MSDDISVGYTIDPSGYLMGVNQIDAANQQLQRSMGGITTSSTLFSRALGMVTPGRATLAGMGAFTERAAAMQESMAGIRATSAVTGVSVEKLRVGINQMARDLPIGNEGAKQVVEQMTKMGVGAAGAERKILSLADTTAKLSGATGENVQSLAQGMVELARATGNTQLDPKRFSDLGDSLTKISAESGASATSTLAFAKNIAPLAQASGIGATGVLGIANAFSKLGEDGLGASTAINKMMSDLSRSVREGSPEMTKYAQIVGMLPDQFDRLFKQNPAEALTQVTEAIAKAGSGGPRLLEQLGIEGVRGQRSIQALVASGGLRESITQATAAYGGGDTAKAAAAAYSGLNDALVELKDTTEQVAEAFGEPLLGPLTSLAKFLKTITAPIAGLAQSGLGQGVLTALSYGGGAALLLKGIIGPLGTAALARQAGTSGAARAVVGAVTEVTGSTGRMARFGEPAVRAAREGRMGPVTGRIYAGTQGLMDAIFPQRQGPQMPPMQGPPNLNQVPMTFLQRARAAGRGYLGGLAETFALSTAQQFDNSRLDPFMRRDPVTGKYAPAPGDPAARRPALVPSPGFSAAAAAARGVDTTGMNAAQSLKATTNAFNKEILTTSAQFVTLNTEMKAFGTMLAAQGKAGLKMAEDVGRAGKALAGGGRLWEGIKGMAPMLGITAAIGAGGALIEHSNQVNEANKALADADISGTMNRYRESIGKSTDATKTFSSITTGINEQLAKNAQLGGFSSVSQVSSRDIQQAEATKDKIVKQYTGTAEEVASEIKAAAPTGIASDELQAIKVDLLRQGRGQEETTRILKMIPATFEAGSKDFSQGDFLKDIRTTVGAAGAAPRDALGNFLALGKGFGALEGQNRNMFLQASPFSPGGVAYRSALTDTAMGQIDAVREGIAQQFSQQGTKFKPEFAQQERIKAMNEALKKAYDDGNVEVFFELSKRFGEDLGGKELAGHVWSAYKFAQQGFDISAQVAEESPAFKEQRAHLAQQGAALGAGATGGISPDLLKSVFYDAIKPASDFLANAFDTSSRSPMSQAMAASMAQPGNVEKQVKAVDVIVQSANAAGKSMGDLATEAYKAAAATAEGTDAWLRLKQVQQRAEQEMAYREQNMTPGQAQLEQYAHVREIAMTPLGPNATEDQRKEVEAAKVQTAQIEGEMRQRMISRLQMQRQADIAEMRMTQDFNRQKAWAKTDYDTSVARATTAHNIQLEQSAHAYNVGQIRAEYDYNDAKKRQLRDFHITQERAERDFRIARAREWRDFNLALARQIEDAASSMYDPYKRIQTQATWDARNLIVNIEEQTAKLAEQKANLDKLRNAGLSQQSIDQLGLGKAENALQVANLVQDQASDPAVIAALNKAAADKAAAAGTLFTDQANKDLRRQREDFNKSLQDQLDDFNKSLGDMNADLEKSLKDSEHAFNVSQGRVTADYNYNLQQSNKLFNQSLAYMEGDYNKALNRSQAQLDTSLARMHGDLLEADHVIAGSMEDLAAQYNKAIHGQAVHWQGIMKNDSEAWIKDMQANVIPQIKQGIFVPLGMPYVAGSAPGPWTAGYNQGPNSMWSRPVGNAGAGSTAAAEYGWNYTPASTWQSGYAGSLGHRSEGGPITGYSPHAKADNILTWVTGGEFVQNVAAVKHYGTELMTALNNRAIPKAALIAARGYAVGGWINPVAPVQPGFPWGHYPSGGVHRALDYPVPVGTPVHAPYAGDIVEAGWSTTGFGNKVGMHNVVGTYSILGHNSRLLVKPGQHVGQGQVVSLSGATGHVTGPHVHLEMRTRYWDPFSAYDFTKIAPMAAFFSDVASVVSGAAQAVMPRPTLAQLFAGMKNKPGIYNELTDKAKQIAKANFFDSGGELPHGGVGINLSGSPEKVLTASQWSSLSALAASGGHGIGPEDVRGIRAAGGVHITINNSGAVTYDSRNDFSDACITVVSSDPDEMARKLRRRATEQKLTQTRGVRR